MGDVTKVAILLAIAIASFFAGKAIAGITFQNNLMFKTSDGFYYLGATPNSTIQIDFAEARVSSVIQSNPCGVVVLRKSTVRGSALAGTVTINGSSIAAGNPPTQLLPSCVNGQLSEARSQNFFTPENYFVIVGRTPSTPFTVSWIGGRRRALTINACGFGRFKPKPEDGERIEPDGINIPDEPPTVSIPPRCLNGVLFIPVGVSGYAIN